MFTVSLKSIAKKAVKVRIIGNGIIFLPLFGVLRPLKRNKTLLKFVGS